MSEHRYIAEDPALVNGIHIRRMGMAIWLLKFLLMKQTAPDGSVYYGKPITYRWIFQQIPNCVPERTLRLWMASLRVNGYVHVETVPYGGMKVKILNSRKWPTTQLGLFEANRSLSIICDLDEENARKSGKHSRQDVDGIGVNMLPHFTLLKEKDSGTPNEKRKRHLAVVESVEKRVRQILAEKYPKIKEKKIS